jgi:hypothetical protein
MMDDAGIGEMLGPLMGLMMLMAAMPLFTAFVSQPPGDGVLLSAEYS